MNVHVCLESIGAVESLSTQITFESLLVGVDALVALVEAEVSKSLVTNLTFELFHPCQN